MTRTALIGGHRPGADHSSGLAGLQYPAWMDHGQCRRRFTSGDRKGQLIYPPETFYPGQGQGYAEALAVCGHCPVTQQCLAWAMVNESGHTDWCRFGMYGGRTPEQRAQLARETT